MEVCCSSRTKAQKRRQRECHFLPGQTGHREEGEERSTAAFYSHILFRYIGYCLIYIWPLVLTPFKAPSPQTPESISVCTPLESSDIIILDNLPFFQFLTLFESQGAC
jgi:hypothetical protein